METLEAILNGGIYSSIEVDRDDHGHLTYDCVVPDYGLGTIWPCSESDSTIVHDMASDSNGFSQQSSSIYNYHNFSPPNEVGSVEWMNIHDEKSGGSSHSCAAAEFVPQFQVLEYQLAEECRVPFGNSKKRSSTIANGDDQDLNNKRIAKYREINGDEEDANGGIIIREPISPNSPLSNAFEEELGVVAPRSCPKRKSRATRVAATDPQSVYARKRREKINERLRVLQSLVPNGTKVDLSTMLEEAVQYVKFLQLQIKLLSSDELWMYAPLAYNGMDIGDDFRLAAQRLQYSSNI